MTRSISPERQPLGVRLASWELWKTPRAMLAYVLAVEVVAFPLAAALLVLAGWHTPAAGRFAVLCLLAIGFEEFSTRIARLRTRLTSYSHVDMTSVWTFAAAMVLPVGWIAPLCLVLLSHVWFRNGRAGGYRAYRHVFAGTVVVVSCYLARFVYVATAHGPGALSSGAGQVVSLGAALVSYFLINGVLLYTAFYLAMRPVSVRSLFASWADLSLEIATLCLGGLTAIALLREPLLAVLVVPPMFVLQRSVLTKQLEIAATTDAKTGLLNAATWHHVAGVELSRAERENYGAALLIVDMDNFKLINDTHGHLVGDDVLKAVADALAEELRGYDSLGRFGGEEFVAVLSEVDELTALMISERIRQRITELEVAARTEGLPALNELSCSIGVACFPTHGTDTETLLHAADAALYAAKRGGRNRVELSSSSV